MSSQLDTSGAVDPWPFEPETPTIRWSDLSPFAQGYVEALFASAALSIRYETGSSAPERRDAGFRDLAPEALALILRDCEFVIESVSPWEWERNTVPMKTLGANFWRDRQADKLPMLFPPQTPYLDDTGKVQLREGGQ